MSATITWSILAMDAYPQTKNQTNVVFNVHWVCEGTQNLNEKTYRSSIPSICEIVYVDGSPYTEFNNLTLEQVLNWVWNSVDKAAIETFVQTQIDEQINPSVIQLSPPWATV
jgi:hypothetical protein